MRRERGRKENKLQAEKKFNVRKVRMGTHGKRGAVWEDVESMWKPCVPQISVSLTFPQKTKTLQDCDASQKEGENREPTVLEKQKE